MEERLPLYWKGQQAGEVLKREEGLHCVFLVRCLMGEGVRKVWLCGDRGRLLLGTLIPEGNEWRLQRRVARRELERQGFADRVWGEIVPVGETAAGKKEESPPVLPVADPVLRCLFRASDGANWRRTEEGWMVTFSWQVGQPVPWLPLVCFACPVRGGLSFSLGKDGWPANGNKK